MTHLQSVCISALMYHWERNRPDRRHLLGNVLILFYDMRRIGYEMRQAEESLTIGLKDKLFDIQAIPPLLLEMVSA